MRLLIDENLPKRLKNDFNEHEIFTVRDKGWNGITNGELLELMIADKFDAFLTFDKNLQHQQNFSKYSVSVFVLTARILLSSKQTIIKVSYSPFTIYHSLIHFSNFPPG